MENATRAGLTGCIHVDRVVARDRAIIRATLSIRRNKTNSRVTRTAVASIAITRHRLYAIKAFRVQSVAS